MFPAPNPATRRRCRRRRERMTGDAAPAKAPELVMGKVTILKREEALPQLPATAVAPAASPARKARAEVSYAGAYSIASPSPMDVPMPIGSLKNLILSH